MSQFGVSAVHWSDDLTQVVECRVHTLEEVDGLLRLTGGIAYPFAYLARWPTSARTRSGSFSMTPEVSPESSPLWSFKIR